MNKQAIEAVIFDLDGVLADTAHFHFLAWRELAQTQGIDFDETFNECLKGVDRMASLELILRQSSRNYTHEEKQVLANKKNQHYQQLTATMTPADLLPGAREALEAVRSAGLKTGLASVSKNAFFILERLEIRDCFDDVVDAALLTHTKPHPEIFLTAANHLGIDPSACIGVEDSLAGITSIKAAGMFALGIGSANVLTDADLVIPDLRHFLLNDYAVN
ncbi:beta-phosphoglucomutase [Undibacterium jejuense]|uniref:Beta-phosphoglucomutase n=1 Tax=Undibacterium jejuense TaxID=1344949 RepID=A0A923HK67_9BURK|nr:beta-phosphoglucomutase [Undibacterium jejuense]MBC3861171.1 beta-phosphoglucomutase [Undibacterium jejuense]